MEVLRSALRHGIVDENICLVAHWESLKRELLLRAAEEHISVSEAICRAIGRTPRRTLPRGDATSVSQQDR